ncbi:Homoserine dehydrogenase [Anaeromyxobacter dehalogenans 2CP-1]|uniref:Homoserine dehydrogenase n=1 Tax=Anaeromyxobacter dehalogenans (strain ATCC BAA-258 / DSM 21875 / 2CP-1) TaxID=455488 RepID=B8JAC9_ANAD2|nr:homoserine dehydrogenase [Anaeromyxobacter dehalogenans]ACL65648.1 Homoserine dehydrogenase [Anaeromyxobacter dehalogenans 2CP-1]
MREVGIGIAGFGVVGGGVLSILRQHAGDIEARLGGRIVVRRVALRDLEKERSIDVDPALLTTRLEDLLEDPGIQVVVELIGGVDQAFELVCGALQRGKHVVTANKALLAARGDEIFRLARARGVDVYYEAAVCGGVPIIRTLREALASDRITALHGIVNGTTNFILTAMAEKGEPIERALAEAQRLGYAEADPTLDVSGGDAAQKLCVLAQLAFGAALLPADVLTEGIMALKPEDFRWAREFGYALKLLAVARRCGPAEGAAPGAQDQLEARVHPAFIPAGSLLAGVRGAMNAVVLHSEALGASMLYGQGAGAMPTGSAVVSDIIDLTRNILAGSPGRVPLPPAEPLVSVRPHAEVRCAYYLNFSVQDAPGVLARIASQLAARHISIAAVQQREQNDQGQPVPLVIVTHVAREADLRAAIADIDRDPTTLAPTRLIRIESV